MKVVEWLSLLDEPHKSQALDKIREGMGERMLSLMSDAINIGLTWHETPQGREYWDTLFKEYLELEKIMSYTPEWVEKRKGLSMQSEAKRLQFSSSMKDMLDKICGDSMVAKYLLCPSYTTNDFANYVTTRQGMLSFLPNGREHKVNAETGRWLRDGRQEMKPAKLSRKLIKDNYLQDLSDAEFEKFGNKVRAYLGVVGDEDGEGKNIKLEIIDGEPIRNAYYGGNYSKLLGDSTNLHGSCMRSDSSQKYFGIYVENTDKVKMLVAKDEENKILGRALLWNFDDGDMGMDTIYGPDIVAQLMIDWAVDNNYWFKSNQSCHHHIFDRHGLDRFDNDKLREMGKIIRNVTLNKAEFDYYPYVDSLYYLCNDISKWFLSNTYNNVVEKTLRDTGGSYEEYEDDDDYVTLENGDRCHQDDACYLDYRCHDDRVDGYYHESDCIYCMDDTSRLREHCTRIGGDWYGLDDDAIVWVDSRDAYYLDEDTIYCEYSQETLHINDAVELATGDYCDLELAFKCAHDDQWYHKDDMIQLPNDLFIAKVNEESYLEQLKENENETEREGVIA